MNLAFRSLVILLTLTSCKSIVVDKESKRRADSPITLVMIGDGPSHLFKNNFQSTAFPKLESKIKLQVEKTNFNKRSFQNYLKRYPENPLRLSYVDSIANKPQMLKIVVADRVQLLEELNEIWNRSIVEFLIANKNAKMVTELSLATSKDTFNEMANAKAIYLSSSNDKEYEFILVADGKDIKRLPLNSGKVIGYELSNFCWGENERHKVRIMALVKEGNSCQGNLKKDAQRVIKKDIFERL